MATPSPISGPRPDVAIVGGGIVGLSCAWWLRDAGASVIVADPAPGTGHSVGAGRMFRHAHRNPMLTALAARASMLWDQLAERLPRIERPLLARVGALHTMPRATDLARLEESMRAHELGYEILDAGALGERWPALGIAPEAGLLDPAGGRIEAAAALAALRDGLRHELVATRVTELVPDRDGVSAHVVGGRIRAGSALVAAGLETRHLLAPLGIEITADRALAATRLTFRAAGETPPLPCIHERSGQLPEPLAYLFPGEWGGVSIGLPSEPAMMTTDIARRIRDCLERALPGQRWTPDAVVGARLEVLDDSDHDRIEVHRAGPVWAVAGWNLFKHAPAIGEGMAALVTGHPAPLLERLPGARSGDPAAGGARRTAR